MLADRGCDGLIVELGMEGNHKRNLPLSNVREKISKTCAEDAFQRTNHIGMVGIEH